MYGARDSAQNWAVEHTDMMKGTKFKQGAHSECFFYFEERSIRTVVHGEDFTILGKSVDLEWLRKEI